MRQFMIIAAATLCGAAVAAPVPIVVDGQARASIVTTADASETVRLAARELQEYLGKMSGAALQIVTEAPSGQPAILLGQAAAGELPAGTLDALGPDGFVIKTTDPGLVLAAGRTDLGTLNAAYDILDGLGVRWFWPGEIGESVPEHSTIYIPDLDRTFEPGFARRHIWAPDTRLPKDLRAQYNDWQRRNRMPGPLTGSMGHAYNRIVKTSDPELFAQHPEYFAQVGGKRVMNAQICTTNPDVIQRAIAYARDYFAQNPGDQMVSMSPSDGGGFCECDVCRAQGSISDNAVILANHVARDLQTSCPGKYVAMYAYSGTAPPPSVEGEPNLIVWIATSFITGGFTLDQLLTGWAERVRQLGIRDYYSIGSWTWQMPQYDPEGKAKQLADYRASKVVGVLAEAEDNFGAVGPDYYVAARLMYDPDRPLADILDDYYAKCWGQAAQPMRRYWELWRGQADISEELLAQGLRLVQQADGLADSDQVRRRIAAMKAYLHFMRLYREYMQAPPGQAEAARDEMLSYGFSIQPLHMVMTANVLVRARADSDRGGSVSDETVARWRATPAVRPEQIDADFARDLAEIRPLGVARRAFSDNLVAMRLSGKETPARAGYRHSNQGFVLLPASGSAEITVTAGRVRPGGLKLTLADTAGEAVQSVVVPAGSGQRTRLQAGEGGLYRLSLENEGGSAASIDFGSLPHALCAGESTPLVGIGASKGRLCFWVPNGTTSLGVGFVTPDGAGQLTVWGPRGDKLLEQSGNYVMGQQFRIEVPDGQAGGVWGLEISRCEDWRLSLIGVPPYLSQSAATLLVPGEVAP